MSRTDFERVCYCLCLAALVALPLAAGQRGPGAKEQQLLRVQELIERGDTAGARALLAEAEKTFPGDAGFDNLRGVVEAQQGNYRAAESCFKRAVARSPKFIGAYLNLGRLYLEGRSEFAGWETKALVTYQSVLQFRPDHAEANYQSAVLLHAQGKYRQSLVHLARLPAEYRARAQALALECSNLIGLGERGRAGEVAARLLAHPELSEPDVILLSNVHDPAGRDELIARLFENLAARGQASPDALHLLGLTYERLGRLDRAREALQKAAASNRPLAPLLVDLARVARAQKDLEGALGYLAHARDVEPQKAELHFLFGQVAVEMNLGAEAHLAFSRAVALEPENAEFNFAMGAVSAYRHDPTEAVPYFQKYLKLKPQDPRGPLALGAAYFRGKDYAAAREHLLAAARHKQTAAAARFYLGSIARQAGRLDEAERELNAALAANPQSADALAELGQCLLLRKDYAGAEKMLNRALALDPEHYAANFNLLTLYSRTADARLKAQEARFEDVKRRRAERAQDFLRQVEARPE
jgi:tetratricopeptide (TPR) repeat protein